MTTEADLVRTIAADLDDAAGWQVYLDWLLEREDPRAELLRLQTLRDDADDDRERKTLGKEIAKLVDQHGDGWLAAVSALRLPVSWGMHRGVVGTVVGSPSQLATHTKTILAAAPLLTSIEISIDRENDNLEPLKGSALLSRARRIVVSGQMVRVAGWRTLTAPELRALEISNIAVGPDDVKDLVAAIGSKLESLQVSMCRLNARALEPLAQLVAPNLERVDLAAAHVGPPLGAILARFPALRSIRIPGNEIGSDGLAALLPILGQLVVIDLRGNDLVASDVPGLLEALGSPTVLKLGGNDLGPKSAALVAAWPGAASLTQLDIGHDSDQGALAIAESKHLSLALEKLMLGARGIAKAVEHALLDAPRLANARIYVGMKMLGRKKRADELAKASRVKKPAKKQ